jgi:hypothetical protein
MNKVYKDWRDQKDKKKSEVDDEDDAFDPKIQAANKTQKEVQEEKILDEQKRAKVYRNLSQLESSFNPEAAKIVERIEQGREILLDIEVKLPIVVKTDNIGAMFTAQNSSSGVRTRHVDTRYHFARENLDDGIIKIEFVKSVENQSDIFTKNVSQEIYERHVEMFLEDYIEGKFNG